MHCTKDLNCTHIVFSHMIVSVINCATYFVFLICFYIFFLCDVCLSHLNKSLLTYLFTYLVLFRDDIMCQLVLVSAVQNVIIRVCICKYCANKNLLLYSCDLY